MTSKTFPRRVYTPSVEYGLTHDCSFCDTYYSTVDDHDVIHHELSHRRLKAYVDTHGPLMTRKEQRAAEDEAARILANGGLALEAHVKAAKAVLRAHFHRHMRRNVKGAHVERYCAEREFIAAAALERIFPVGVAAELRKEYGRLRRPEIAMTDWNYPP
jgi:hypothetical protein